MKFPILEFSNPVFHAGINTTIRRGDKWLRREQAVIVDGPNAYVVQLETVNVAFNQLKDGHLINQHDEGTRTVDGLLEVMQRVYPGFTPDESITVVYFELPYNYEAPRGTPQA